jgi:hypothetical protein
MLALPQLPVAVCAYKYVEIEIFRTMSSLVRINLAIRVFLQPALTNEIHENQAVFVDVIQ